VLQSNIPVASRTFLMMPTCISFNSLVRGAGVMLMPKKAKAVVLLPSSQVSPYPKFSMSVMTCSIAFRLGPKKH
jgi:hypothetical protein